MKLFIINGENNDKKLKININEYLMVEDIKYKLDEILCGNGNFKKNNFKLIYKNIILWNDDSIKTYKISENDEIWFGQTQNYMRKDDVIVEVTIIGGMYGYEYLILKKHDPISTIIPRIERIFSKVINIWNLCGEVMKNDQIVTDISTNKKYKLIIRCDDREGNEINKTFELCCSLHNKLWFDKYLYYDKIRYDNKNKSNRKILRNQIIRIRQTILSNHKIDSRLNQNLSQFPSLFLNSSNLFCINMLDRILEICDILWRFVINKYEYDVKNIFDQYIPFAIIAALLMVYENSHSNKIKINQSIGNIVIDALDYFMKCLNDSNNDWRFWSKIWMNQNLLGNFSDDDLNERIDKCNFNKFSINVRIKGRNSNRFIPSKPENINEAKKLISKILNVEIGHLYCIKPGADHKSNNEDAFQDEYIIEIVMNMDDIEILRSLGRGEFSKIYLCRDIISNKEFVLKKSIKSDSDFSRNINICAKFNSSKNIINYSGLFKHKENICIGMEYLSGGSLRSYLDEKKHLSEQEIVKISYEILTQIKELHKLGIIHRDIKSDNIVFDEHDNAKLIDFGLSKYAIGLTSGDLLDNLQGYAPGSICYMAPELIKEETYSEKIDIWSFGMVMVEMVTGERPFYWLELPVQAIPKIRDCTKYEYEPFDLISIELDLFIDSCLNTNPVERSSAEQLITSKFMSSHFK